jgi:hypothetical protein
MLNCWKGKNSSIGAAMCHHPLITIPVTKWKRREPGASSRTQKIAETVMIRREVTRIVGLRGLVGWWWFFLVEILDVARDQMRKSCFSLQPSNRSMLHAS